MGPIEKIAHVREDICGRTGAVAEREYGERFGGAAQSFPAAIGDGGYGVAKKLACWIRRRRHDGRISVFAGQN
jgi:hypothetical protein